MSGTPSAGLIDVAQVKRPATKVVTLANDLQQIRGGKTFYQLDPGDAVPPYGFSEAPGTPLRGVGDVPEVPAVDTFKETDLYLARRKSDTERDFLMSSLTLDGANRAAHIGFLQNSDQGTGGLDIGYVACVGVDTAASPDVPGNIPDDVEGHPAVRPLGVSAAYLRMKESFPDVGIRPTDPVAGVVHVLPRPQQLATDLGLTLPNAGYRPIVLQYDAGEELILTKELGDQLYHKPADGQLIISGQNQSFGAGDKTFDGRIIARKFITTNDPDPMINRVLASSVTAYQFIGVSTAVGEESDSDFHILLGQASQTAPAHPGDDDQVVIWAESGTIAKDQVRNSYYAETEGAGADLPVVLMKFPKEVDGTDTHVVASDRGMMRMATRTFEARHGHAFGFDGTTAAIIGVNSTYGAAQMIQFDAAAAIVIPSLILQTSSRPVTGTLQVKITSKDPGTIGANPTRSKGLVAEFTVDLSAEAGNADHVQLVGLHNDPGGGIAGPVFIQRTVANACRLYIQFAYSGAVAGDFGTPRVGGEYTQIGAEFIHEQTDANGPITPGD